jgi:hypothetical protein
MEHEQNGNLQPELQFKKKVYTRLILSAAPTYDLIYRYKFNHKNLKHVQFMILMIRCFFIGRIRTL